MQLLDVVASLRAVPDQRIDRGQVGTVVEVLDADHVLVEFSALNGVAFALAPMPVTQLMELKHAPTFLGA